MKDIESWLKSEPSQLANEIVKINDDQLYNKTITGFGMKDKVVEIIGNLKRAMFPRTYIADLSDEAFIHSAATRNITSAAIKLTSILKEVYTKQCKLTKKRENCDECAQKAEQTVMEFLNMLPKTRALLATDVVAAYNGDPAALYLEEIILSYPSIEAVAIYRLAHELYLLKVPMIPRIMTEYAHQLTGIDIHPGATIGEYFFIDHGTGVVIGETCVIGDKVKLYQGVTLGAKSFEVDEHGNPIKGVKRHPNIEDEVVIYSGATILGGDTTIGKGSVIGGNVWLTKSVPEYSTVYNSQPNPIIK